MALGRRSLGGSRARQTRMGMFDYLQYAKEGLTLEPRTVLLVR